MTVETVSGTARSARTASALVLLLTGAVAACAGRGVPETLEPEIAATAIGRSAPDRPLQVVFDWTVLDGSARFSGSGAARIEPPYRARLDLFGPQGEGYVSAALVGTDLRLPPGAPAIRLPPAAMMWAVLGVVLPPERARLVGTRSSADRTELYYDADGSRLRYTLVDGRLRSATWDGDGRRMAVELSGVVEPGLPRSAFYRDGSAHTELKLELKRVNEVESYPPDIWIPDE